MNPWLPASPCTPLACAGHDGRTRGRAAAVVRLLAGCAFILAGVLGAPFVLLLGAVRREWLIRLWAYGVVRAFGVRVRVIGRRGAGAPGTLVVANHISWLDIPLVAAVFPGRMLAKSEIRNWPLLGRLAVVGGTLFVERERFRALPTTVRDIAAALRGGSRVVAFPEGTTWCGRGGGRFGPAVFQAAIDANATVQPVRITYRAAPAEHTAPAGAAAFVGDDPLIASLWRVVTAAGLTAEIRVLPQIPAGDCPDRRALARLAQTAVANDSANRSPESVHH
ncbi:lysophospholipid acyltransferase family protein [Streptomyces atratus]|uniref:lysophospholipid acyltransferase family protein n=1 Tax=Streptomyces atratus TaxID=1893 RepID=UPI0016711C06|nr:lysophospholipid acyltransferase family protein [Streptomyces atratus]WPW32846.1 lysophospholipid acyltransferase family protein [Streptomyces atratus]GGT49968.1 1-acyl-sn-glycerol-3-phosphate acyltransferase [Streptomyces atratus]